MDPFIRKILNEAFDIISGLQEMAEECFPELIVKTLDSYRKEIYLYTNEGKNIGDFSFEADDYNGYYPIGTASVENEFKNKGYYQSILELLNRYAKTQGKKGICSLQWDPSSGEFERSQDANYVWSSLEKKGKAFSKMMGKDDGLVYFYK